MRLDPRRPLHLLRSPARAAFSGSVMAAFRIRLWKLLSAVLGVFPLHVFAAVARSTAERSGITPMEACVEFASGNAGVFWTLEECMSVWSAWADTIPGALHVDYPDRRLVKEIAAEMRQRGQPCVVQPLVRADGIGSEVTRHLAAWLYAAEVGCDFVTPDFGYYDEESEEGPEGGTLYCHASIGEKELESAPEGAFGEEDLESCELVNWLRFFNLDKPSVPEPRATFRNVTVSGWFSAWTHAVGAVYKLLLGSLA